MSSPWFAHCAGCSLEMTLYATAVGGRPPAFSEGIGDGGRILYFCKGCTFGLYTFVLIAEADPLPSQAVLP